MPSNRKQLNVRADEETANRVERLLLLVSKLLGLQVSRSDLFRLGMIELERKFGGEEVYPSVPDPAAGKAARKSPRSCGGEEGQEERR